MKEGAFAIIVSSDIDVKRMKDATSPPADAPALVENPVQDYLLNNDSLSGMTKK